MTYAELRRKFDSYARTQKIQEQARASYDYILADLIGRSVSRLYSSSAKMPEITEAYPTLFDKERIQEQKAEQKAELSALRFKLFANSHNKRFEEVGKKNE